MKADQDKIKSQMDLVQSEIKMNHIEKFFKQISTTKDYNEINLAKAFVLLLINSNNATIEQVNSLLKNGKTFLKKIKNFDGKCEMGILSKVEVELNTFIFNENYIYLKPLFQWALLAVKFSKLVFHQAKDFNDLREDISNKQYIIEIKNLFIIEKSSLLLFNSTLDNLKFRGIYLLQSFEDYYNEFFYPIQDQIEYERVNLEELYMFFRSKNIEKRKAFIPNVKEFKPGKQSGLFCGILNCLKK